MLPENAPLWVDAASFTAAGALVWAAGTKLARFVSAIARLTGMGHGFAGLLLLGGITSLPEVATVSTSAVSGNGSLAINNLLGSLAINVVMLAVADALIGRDALSSVVGRPTPMLQATLTILLLAVVATASVTGDMPFLGIGLWSLSLLPLFLVSMWIGAQSSERTPWVVAGDRSASGPAKMVEGQKHEPGLKTLIIRTVLASVVITGAGYVLATTGEAIAQKTGIGSSLVGLVLVGAATGLPEISSIYGAVKQRRYEMAIGEIFGTNLWDIVLILLVDILYFGEPIFNLSGPFETVASLLCIVLTSFYIIGLLERRDQTVARMGYDSLAVICTYAAGIALLWSLSPS